VREDTIGLQKFIAEHQGHLISNPFVFFANRLDLTMKSFPLAIIPSSKWRRTTKLLKGSIT
jgi:hypothetical protein